MLAQRLKFHRFSRRSRPKESAGHRRCRACGEVLERTPVDDLAEAPDRPGPVSAMRRAAGPVAPLGVWRLFVWVLTELAAGTALPLDGVDNILPGPGGRNGQFVDVLDVGVFGGDVYAAVLAHRGQHRSEVVHAASRLTERIECLAVRWQ